MTGTVKEQEKAVGSLEAIVIRNAAAADIPRVGEIERSSFNDPWGASDFRAVLHAPQSIFLVAADAASKEIRGYAIAMTVLDESEILNIAVDKAFRGNGLGGTLLDAAIAEVAARGAVSTFLEVRESNAVARKLYESRGFAELSRRRGYYREPVEDALILRRAVQ
jgi:ribosomal-protein-alanine N-acetyltransferase